MKSEIMKKINHVIRGPISLRERLLWKLYFFEIDRLINTHFRNDSTKRDAIILASSGRAGNTFLRFVWLNVISLKELNGKDVDFEMLYDCMPFDAYFNDLKKDWKFRSLPCLVKTHCPYSKRYRGFRAIHFFRNPLDAMVSLYEYLSNRKNGPRDKDFSWIEKKIFNRPAIAFKGSFEDYLAKDIDRYCEYFKSWMNTDAVPASYETLVSEDSFIHFDRIFKKLGIDVEEEILRKAIDRSGKEKLKNKPQCGKMAQLEGMHFIRDGSVGQWKRYFTDENLKFVSEHLSFHGLSDINSFPEQYRPLLVNWPIAGAPQSISRS